MCVFSLSLFLRSSIFSRTAFYSKRNKKTGVREQLHQHSSCSIDLHDNTFFFSLPCIQIYPVFFFFFIYLPENLYCYYPRFFFSFHQWPSAFPSFFPLSHTLTLSHLFPFFSTILSLCYYFLFFVFSILFLISIYQHAFTEPSKKRANQNSRLFFTSPQVCV